MSSRKRKKYDDQNTDFVTCNQDSNDKDVAKKTFLKVSVLILFNKCFM